MRRKASKERLEKEAQRQYEYYNPKHDVGCVCEDCIEKALEEDEPNIIPTCPTCHTQVSPSQDDRGEVIEPITLFQCDTCHKSYRGPDCVWVRNVNPSGQRPGWML